MKRLFGLTLVILAALWAIPGAPAGAVEPGTIVFCESIDDQFNPVKPGTEFTGPTVSWIARAAKPYGKPSITVSIYKKDANQETLIDRKTLEVNPTWNTSGVRNMPVPAEGDYLVALTTADGETLSSGMVRISSMKQDAPVKPEETLGAKLEAMFNKYATKKSQENGK